MKVGVAVNLESGVTICGSGSETIGGISMWGFLVGADMTFSGTDGLASMAR